MKDEVSLQLVRAKIAAHSCGGLLFFQFFDASLRACYVLYHHGWS